jgi:hypothetical protein
MRITPEILHKIAQDTVASRSRSDHSLLAAYLQGSLLGTSPLLGNSTDIDLFFVHTDEVTVEREFVRLTDEVHLDISHHSHRLYRQPRQLRVHPWLGPAVYGCKILYDPQHFMDFTQASVRGQYQRPENVLARARQQVEHARQIWMDLSTDVSPPDPAGASQYLRALEHAANTVACLSGSPLTERRFLVEFPLRAKAVRRPGLEAGLLGLLGGPQADVSNLRRWVEDWRAAYLALPSEGIPPRLNPCRRLYYERGIAVLLEGDHPRQAIWPLWRTWTHALAALSKDTPHLVPWQTAGEHLGLLGSAFAERVAALDAYLDQVEELLETWARENGV